LFAEAETDNLEVPNVATSRIRIVYPCRNTPGIPGSPEYAEWLEHVRQVFAGLKWTVASQGPTMSSTNIDEDELCLESGVGPLPRTALESALRQAGIEPHYWSGDVEESA
jgi:hypothetical protein